MRVRDCQTFGRFSVGTHVLNSLHPYLYPKEGDPIEKAPIQDASGIVCIIPNLSINLVQGS